MVGSESWRKKKRRKRKKKRRRMSAWKERQPMRMSEVDTRVACSNAAL